MKKLYLAGKTVLGLALLLLVSSCSTETTTYIGQQPTETSPRFRDEASVNAVLRFSSWDYTFLTHPQYTENGFLQQVRRDNIGRILDKLNVRRGTAAVVIGWTYNGETLDRLVEDWKTILGGCGFQRVVILRAQVSDRLNGSVIVDDSILHVGSAESASRGG
jgi:hypothetical protein